MKKPFRNKREPFTRRLKKKNNQGLASKAKQAVSEKSRGEESALDVADVEVTASAAEGDELSLSWAKTQWLFGEWQRLVVLDKGTFLQHPDRDRFALLVASAHQQLGNHDKARKYARMALGWGCPSQVVAQVLIAGVHNTLGRIASLNQDEPRMARHFEASIVAIGARDTEALSHTRSIREMARLGLLPQATALIDQQLQVAQKEKRKPQKQEALLEVLKTKMELLSHELSLAQQRRHVFPSPTSTEDESSEFDPTDPQRIEELKKSSFSQIGQDLWVLEQTNYKRDGFFVEFGATDGVLLSNTYLLEKRFGWRGICAEPNPKFYEKLKSNRNCQVSNSCIGKVTEELVEFVFADAYGGMVQHSDDDMHGEKRKAYRETGDVAVLKTISLHDFLKESNAPYDIDYLSIDTEGSEYEILSVFPLEEWNVKLFTIEHNYTERRGDIRKLMEKNGYACTESQFDDWYEKILP